MSSGLAKIPRRVLSTLVLIWSTTELNKRIEENADYDEIYKLSVELDELIAKYYKLKTI